MKRKLMLRRISFASMRIIVSVLFVATAIGSLAETFTTIVTFNGTNGRSPGYGPLVQGRDGNLYGTTEIGGLYDAGTLFQLNPVTDALTTIYNFCNPQTNCADGGSRAAGVILGIDGSFYGTTMAGGDLNCDPQVGCGTVFKMTSKGVLTTLYTFTGNGDGFTPVAPLVQATDGSFYGTTGQESGTVFKVTPSGKFKTLHVFQYPEGNSLFGGLMQATDGNFYGTSHIGGTGNDPHCSSNGCGTVFKVTPKGKLTTLYSFDFTDGAFPVAGLLQASDGNLYGTTDGGGSGSYYGTIFSLDLGFGPFVQATTYSGKVGATVEFLGQGFIKSSMVSFNGTPATPTVRSGTYLTVEVPAGATTGPVTITTSMGTLESNKIFRVIP